MTAMSLAWLIKLKALLKSIYSIYISWFVSLASLSVEMKVCSCRNVHLSALKSSWLSCKIWYLSPYTEKILVSVLVNNLYIVLASAIGL